MVQVLPIAWVVPMQFVDMETKKQIFPNYEKVPKLEIFEQSFDRENGLDSVVLQDHVNSKYPKYWCSLLTNRLKYIYINANGNGTLMTVQRPKASTSTTSTCIR